MGVKKRHTRQGTRKRAAEIKRKDENEERKETRRAMRTEGTIFEQSSQTDDEPVTNNEGKIRIMHGGKEIWI